ncbi:UPF0157 protein [Cercospora beticola]|uniref:UPF0157 protein n=1 Tax=Cercospora beticola TaxID=122368 RepID=A0A2G5HYB6_CERBT|nr:UPF0157 protein [Cercospora beticola]PIA97554.1 UPF0157 protein [Cercospora beticola]WPA98441.1 hypothetical protein RHO25_003053 [Cercospora beticola]
MSTSSSASAAGMQDFLSCFSVSEILHPLDDDGASTERISERKVPASLDIIEPDPEWPTYFDIFKSRITSAWESQQAAEDGKQVKILSISHVGSTAVPGLPAKAIIDIDLVLSEIARPFEPFYVPRLEAAGFQYLLREPSWYEHRLFIASEPISCNLHVFGPRCAMVARHWIFRDWLKDNSSDRELYAQTKRECAQAAKEKGVGMQEYSRSKDAVVMEILTRAVKGAGLASGEE